MSNKNFSKIGTGRMFCDLPDWINPYEDEFQSDCSRLIYSPSFRRLQGKTQLYPNNEFDYFRSRLTHSLEVNEIAQCIGARINRQIRDMNKSDGFFVSSDVLRFACLAHDLGHPPFGHDGERQLNCCMADADGFNGNSQTFRILTRIEKGCINLTKNADVDGERSGLNITFRSLASVLKHIEKPKEIEKGFYPSEKEIIERIYKELGSSKYLCTIEGQIMDISDDISNAVHDLDDSLKAKLLNPFDLFFPQIDVLKEIAKEVFHKDEKDFTYKNDEHMKSDFIKIYNQLNIIFEESGLAHLTVPKDKDIFETISPIYKKLRMLSSDGDKRTLLIYNLKNKFIESLSIEYNDESPLFSKLIFNDGINDDYLQIKILQAFHFHYQCRSFYIESRAFRGKYIVKQLFYSICKDPRLMPDDYYAWYESFKALETDDSILKLTKKQKQKRCVCDFISGMTDRYCLEFYGRLYSETPQSIFKPL